MNKYLLQTTLAAAEAMPHLRFVKLDETRLAQIAWGEARRIFPLPRWDTPGVEPQSDVVFPSYCFWWNVINYCFNYSQGDGSLGTFTARDVRGEVRRGSYAMAAVMYRHFGEKKILSENMWPLIESFSAFKKNFAGVNSMPLQKSRWAMLCDACETLEFKFGGDPDAILEEGHYRVASSFKGRGILSLLMADFPSVFGNDRTRDEYGWFGDGGREFYFLKRPQLFLLMYHDRASQSEELLTLGDVASIGPIVDYQIPRGYRDDGVLHYSFSLSASVADAEPLLPGYRTELELRIATFHALTLELEFVNELRGELRLPLIHMGHLDAYRWQRGRASKTPPHLCFTTNY